jgi:hypothetical protein
MSLIFNANGKSAAEKRHMQGQLIHLNSFRRAGGDAMNDLLDATVNHLSAANVGQTPADAYREFDPTTKVAVIEGGKYATLTRAMQFARSVSIGREVFEYRKASKAGSAKTSMSGQVGIVTDQVDYKYGGTVVPIHDVGYGRSWREVESGRAEAFDALVDDSREAERTLMETIESYLWDGDADIEVKGRSWLGLRNDPTVASEVLGVDLTSAAVSAVDKQKETKRLRDVLKITNNCSGDVKLAVSREIMSAWEELVDTGNGSNITTLEFISKLRGISEIYEDAALTGNQIAMLYCDQSAFHPVVGMAISSYALPRVHHNDDFNFIKWAAVGFMSKTDYDDNTCALYAE